MLIPQRLALLAGVEVGVIADVGSSLLPFLYRTSRPHIALVWQVPDTEYYRNG
jgi:SulP family sulfate permease